MNARCAEWMQTRQHDMYKLGYPYASWVVRKTWFGLRTECSLQFVREPPSAANVDALFGTGVLRVSPAI